jgi:hypothetical protein
MSLITTYFPAPSDLAPTDLQSTRAELQAWLAPAAPEGLDMRPGSVFGAWGLDPLTILVQGILTAVGRMREDLDVAGVANGVVYDCDFVQKYLLALGGRQQEAVNTVGYVQLVFSANADVDISSATRLQFHNQDVYTFNIPGNGTIKVRQMGSAIADPQTFPLTMLASGSYAVILPVTGYSSTVVAGDTASLDTTIPNLTAATAFSDFIVGRVNNSVPAIARRTAQTFQASGFITKTGTRNQLQGVFPDLQTVAAISSNDPELYRAAVNALGVTAPAMDIFVRSFARQVVNQTIRLNYISEQNDVAVGKFIGAWVPMGTPTRLDAVSCTGQPTLQLTWSVFSQSASSLIPLLTAAYSTNENFELVVNMPVDVSNTPLIQLSQDANGSYALFTLTYETDPAVGIVQAYINQDMPAGVSVQVRAPMQMLISSLHFQYTKEPGVLFNTDQAIADVTSYFNGLNPPTPFSASDMNDRVFSAGAAGITGVDVSGQIKLSIADQILSPSSTLPSVNYALAVSQAVAAPVLNIISLDGLNSVYTDPNLGQGGETLGVLTAQNLARTVLSGAITFEHVGNV